MFTPFRDGLQSVFGGKTRLGDILPAIEASAAAGIRHFEFGGGARFQAPFFYVGEDPFQCMSTIRKTVGPDADLQILTRSVSGVTLNTQRTSALALQAKLMKKHGTTIDRNFDFMNDVGNLVKTGQPIVDAGMHHQVCVALMGLPFQSDQAHTPEFYINIVRELLKRGIRFDSVCLKDASGTTDPRTCYETAKGIKAILPPEIPLIQHTHDTASTAVACYMAGIDGGVDGIDLAVRPLASGTSQPDVRSMAHALKGTGYSLDIDHTKMDEIESLLNEGLSEYEFNPVTTSADARVVGFPMPGGAIGPNVHMMQSAGILDKYSAVLAEFPEVVVAIKDSSGDWANTEALFGIDGLTVYPGAEIPLLDALDRGGPGCITATANVNAGPVAEVIRLHISGGRPAAEVAMEGVRAFRLLMQEYPAIPTQKRLLALRLGDPIWATVRPPFLPADEAVGIRLEERIAEL